MRAVLFGALLATATVSAAEAQTYCRNDRIRVCDGCDATFNWYVVASTVPRPAVPGRRPASGFCAILFQGLGTLYRPIEIIRRPALGEVRVGRYGVGYRSARTGQDALTFRLHWLHPHTGRPTAGTVTMMVQVRDRPL